MSQVWYPSDPSLVLISHLIRGSSRGFLLDLCLFRLTRWPSTTYLAPRMFLLLTSSPSLSATFQTSLLFFLFVGVATIKQFRTSVKSRRFDSVESYILECLPPLRAKGRVRVTADAPADTSWTLQSGCWITRLVGGSLAA
jgi:hypothetical protein